MRPGFRAPRGPCSGFPLVPGHPRSRATGLASAAVGSADATPALAVARATRLVDARPCWIRVQRPTNLGRACQWCAIPGHLSDVSERPITVEFSRRVDEMAWSSGWDTRLPGSSGSVRMPIAAAVLRCRRLATAGVLPVQRACVIMTNRSDLYGKEKAYGSILKGAPCMLQRRLQDRGPRRLELNMRV